MSMGATLPVELSAKRVRERVRRSSGTSSAVTVPDPGVAASVAEAGVVAGVGEGGEGGAVAARRAVLRVVREVVRIFGRWYPMLLSAQPLGGEA